MWLTFTIMLIHVRLKVIIWITNCLYSCSFVDLWHWIIDCLHSCNFEGFCSVSGRIWLFMIGICNTFLLIFLFLCSIWFIFWFVQLIITIQYICVVRIIIPVCVFIFSGSIIWGLGYIYIIIGIIVIVDIDSGIIVDIYFSALVLASSVLLSESSLLILLSTPEMSGSIMVLWWKDG